MVFEPKYGRIKKTEYNWLKITVECLVNLPEEIVKNYQLVAAFRNPISVFFHLNQ